MRVPAPSPRAAPHWRSTGAKCSRRANAGGATLLLVAGLALVLTTMAAFSQRHLLSGLQLSSTHYQTAKAFEAAQAGLDWTLARLNHPAPVDEQCQLSAVSAPHAHSFADRLLPREATPPGGAGLGSAGARCIASAGTWQCSCGPLSATATASPGDSAEAVRFETQLLPAGSRRPDRLQLVSWGCHGGPIPCSDDRPPASAHSAVSRLQVTLARMPALAHAPAAALTVRGALTLGAHPWRIDNAGGVAVHTGDTVTASAMVARSAPGSPTGSAPWLDASLRQQAAEVAFASLLHVPASTWRQLPSVQRVPCAAACDRDLGNVTAAPTATNLLWLDGGLHTERPLTLGTAARPVVIVSDGPVVLRAPLVVHGLVITLSPDWSATAGSVVHGAVVAAGSLRGQGVQQVRYDSEVLRRLQTQGGTWLRVPGSWKDF